MRSNCISAVPGNFRIAGTKLSFHTSHKTKGRYFEAFPAVSQVKQELDGSGFGGDWALRIGTSLREELSTATSYAPSRRISFVFYMADESTPTQDWILPVHENAVGYNPATGSPIALPRKPMCLVMGGNKDIGPWSLHAMASGSSSSSILMNYLSGEPRPIPMTPIRRALS